MSDIEIVALEPTKKNIRAFVMFAWKIYRNYPQWSPPLIHDQVNYILKGPYHDSGFMQAFMAYSGNRPVGRIIAHFDTRHNEYHNEKRGCVGFFECIDDPEVSRKLFAAAEKWLAEQGMQELYGPLNFLMYDASGLLVDRFDEAPALECVYNPPYYEKLFLDYGFTKRIDWYGYRFPANTKIPESLLKIRDRVYANKEGITFRPPRLDKLGFIEDALKMLDIFNDAWKGNWGHLPITRNQFLFNANSLRRIVKPELLIIAEHHGKPVGFVLSVPDVNQAIRRANGRLFPLGLVRMLLGLRKINRIKVFMLGVLPEYRRKGLDLVFYLETLERARKIGYLEGDCSVIVETNADIITASEHFGAMRHKTYRHFSKPIDPA
jgi:GNAT superfamily N-acetyltransferase